MPAIIWGSSRGDGHTRRLVDFLQSCTSAEVFDLNDYEMSYYDYAHRNRDDDFRPLMERLVAHRCWVFATPVYWYTMSAVMKTFFDRLTDLLDIYPDLRARVVGIRMGLVMCSSDAELIPGFPYPFQATADYLDMVYLHEVHGWIENDRVPLSVQEQLRHLGARMLTKA